MCGLLVEKNVYAFSPQLVRPVREGALRPLDAPAGRVIVTRPGLIKVTLAGNMAFTQALAAVPRGTGWRPNKNDLDKHVLRVFLILFLSRWSGRAFYSTVGLNMGE